MFRHHDLQMCGLKLNKMSNFHHFEVVCRGSETQLKVGGKFFLFNLMLLW